MFEGREWVGFDGASAAQLSALQSAAPRELPASYYELLAASNGGEGPLPVQPCCLCLDPADEVTERILSRNYGQKDFDGFVIFGGNGGGEYLAFDVREAAPWPIVSIDMMAGAASAAVVAPDFDAFLRLVGCAEQ